MSKDNERILRQVRYEVTELRKLGEDWGMSSLQINQCISEAFCQKLTSQIPVEKIAKKIQQGTKWSKIRLAFRLWMAFIITVFGLFIIMNHTEYLGKAIDKALQPYGYPIFRAVRLLALPLHQYNISSYHNRDCVVINPYFFDEEDECLCQGISKVRVTRLKKEKELGAQFIEIPILFKGLQKELVPLKRVVKMVQEYEKLQDPSLLVQSSVDWIQNIGDFNDLDLETKILKEANFHIEWDSRRISTSQALRALFPRPVVYPKKSEIVIMKSLFIAGPYADGVHMNAENKANDLFYVQGWGERTVVFIPKESCEDICDPFEVITEAGDVLLFPNSWNVELMQNEEEISVSFLGGVA